MKSSLPVILIFLLAPLLFPVLSCKKELDRKSTSTQDQAPVARAGYDQVVYRPADSTWLDGSSSYDPNGTITYWQWRKLAGPSGFSISGETSPRARLSQMQAGMYQFELTIRNNRGTAAADTVVVMVIEPNSINQPPVARAGADQVIVLPNDSTVLDGSRSFDADNNISSYNWQKISGPSGFRLANPQSAVTSLSGLVAGTYEFELTVRDVPGLTGKDTVRITVYPPSNPGNVFFYIRDRSGSITGVLEGFSPRIVLARVRINGFLDAEIEGVWGRTPICPMWANYTDETAYGTFNLPPGTYNWTAESVTTNLPGYPLPVPFVQWWSSGPHYASGTVTVNPGETCIIKRIDF